MQDLKKHTPESHPDYKNIGTALEKMEEMAQRINDAKKRDESFRRMTDIDKKLRGDLEVTLNHDPSNNIAAFFFLVCFGVYCFIAAARDVRGGEFTEEAHLPEGDLCPSRVVLSHTTDSYGRFIKVCGCRLFLCRCDCCGKYIGALKSGFECSSCQYKVHEECFSHAADNCGTTKTVLAPYL